MLAKSFTVFALVASVAAQSSKSANSTATATSAAANASASAIIGGLSPCILACVEPAAQLNNCSFTDAACVCASEQFQVTAAACLNEHCTPADVAAALALQTSQCTAAGIKPTGTASVPQSIPFTLASSATGASSGTAASGSTTAAGTGPATGSHTGAAASSTPTSPATTGATSAPAPTKTSAAQSLTVGLVGLLAAVAGVLAL